MSLSFKYASVDDVRKKLLGLDVSDVPDSLLADIDNKYLVWAQRDVDTFCGQNFDATTVDELYNGNDTPVLILRHRPVREILNVTLKVIPSFQWFQFRRWFYTRHIDSIGIQVTRFGGVEPKNDALTQSGQAQIPLNIPYIFDPSTGFANTDPIEPNQTADFSPLDEQYGRSDIIVEASTGLLTIPPRILFLENQTVPFWNYTWISGFNNIRVKYTYGYSDPANSDTLVDSTQGNLPAEITDATAALAAIYVLKAKGIFLSGGAISTSMDGVNRNFGEMPYAGLIKSLQEGAYQLLKPYKRILV